jgi:hypothetical protein
LHESTFAGERGYTQNARRSQAVPIAGVVLGHPFSLTAGAQDHENVIGGRG